MSLLRDIEQKIEGLFERSFRRAFRSSLQPVELARKLAREMEDHKTVSVSRVYVPNEFTVYLAPQDRAAFATYESSLTTELAAYLEAHARTAGLTLVAPAAVSLMTDTDLRVGEFGIGCRMAEAPPAEEPAAPEAAPEPQPAEDKADAEAPAAPQPPPALETPAPVDVPPPPPVPPAATPPPPPRPYQPLEGVSGTQVISAQEAHDAGLVPEVMTLVVGVNRHRVAKRVTTLGRSRDCDVLVPDPNASRVHAEIRHVGLDYYLVDMGSTNGTEVNGQVVKRHALTGGDVIVMGTTEIHVELA